MRKSTLPLAATVLAVTLYGAGSACAQQPTLPGAAAVTPRPTVRLDAATRRKAFDQVWNTVYQKHYDEKFNGVDWKAVRRKYAATAIGAKTDDAFYKTLNTMLGELKQSHLGVAPPDDEVEAGGAMRGTGDTGIYALLVEGQPVVVRVAPGSPAEKAGVKPGYAIVSVGDRPVAPLLEKVEARKEREGEKRVTVWQLMRGLLSGRVGEPVSVTFKAEGDAEKTVEIVRAAPTGRPTKFGNLPPIPAEVETKTLENGVGYIRFNIFLLEGISEPVKRAVAQFARAGAPGIIFDLRGNPGGLGAMASGIAGTFTAKPVKLGTMKTREMDMTFTTNPQAPRYAGPVVILTDEASLSTSEIMAGGLQEMKRATVIGRPTGGMVLPSQVVQLEGGGRFQFVFADFRTPKGVLLEGKGVQPDIPIELTREKLLADPDPVLTAALDHIKNAATPAAAAAVNGK